MLCQRCGYDISDSAIICPSCGANTSRSSMPPPTSYGDYSGGYASPQPQPGAGYNQGYQQGYAGPGNYMPPPQAAPQPQQVNYGYANPAPPYSTVNVVINNGGGGSNKNSAALVVEVIASLFGIYGIGWLMAGETTTGILLLIGSFVLYWPIFIVGSIITFGLGLVCLGPLGIAAIIINAILLNNTLNRKAAQVVIVPPMQQMPPQYPRM